MKEKPIIFTGDSVPLIRSGRKTQTRRPVKLPPGMMLDGFRADFSAIVYSSPTEPTGTRKLKIPHRVGDVLYVKETWSTSALDAYPCPAAWFRADFGEYEDPVRQTDHIYTCPRRTEPNGLGEASCWHCIADREGPFVWKSPLFMPRRLARIFLEVTRVKVQRLWDISDRDAEAEGLKRVELDETDDMNRVDALWYADGVEFADAQTAFRFKWDGKNGKTFPSESNPWVIAYEFKERR